jgi:hypothetical protein
MEGSKEHNMQRENKVEMDKEREARTGGKHTTLTLTAIWRSPSKIADQATSSWAYAPKAEGTGSLEAVGYTNETGILSIVPIGCCWRRE